MTPIPYVKHCSWDHLLITWEPRSNAVLYYCAKVLYFFIFLEIVFSCPWQGPAVFIHSQRWNWKVSEIWLLTRVYLRWQKRKRFEYYKIIQLVLHTFTTTAFKSWPPITISILEIATSNYDWRSQLQITISMQFRICVKMCETKYSPS